MAAAYAKCYGRVGRHWPGLESQDDEFLQVNNTIFLSQTQKSVNSETKLNIVVNQMNEILIDL